MNRLLPAALLALTCNVALAAGMPWQEPALGQSPEYCMGLVVGGLSSKKVGGMDRSELWQAWSYLIRGGALEHVTASSEYNSGLALFNDAADTDAATAILEEAMGDCGLGRSNLQITGW